MGRGRPERAPCSTLRLSPLPYLAGLTIKASLVSQKFQDGARRGVHSLVPSQPIISTGAGQDGTHVCSMGAVHRALIYAWLSSPGCSKIQRMV